MFNYLHLLRTKIKILLNKYKTILIELLIFLLLSLAISQSLIRDESILKTNDMAGNIVNLVYIKKIIIEEHSFPQWNPYNNLGVPIVADPLSTFLNPIVLITFLLFPISVSIKIIYFLSIFLAGVFFYYLLRYFKIQISISFLLALTYMSSGYLAARIYAGHIEKILSVPLIPLLIFSVYKIQNTNKLIWSSATAIILSFFIFSGGIYEFYYSLIFIFLVCIYNLLSFIFTKNKLEFKKITYLIISVLLVLPFSAVKLLPLIEISPFISHVKTPFLGSQNIISLLYNLFLPNKEPFYLLGLNKFLEFPYFWWESLAFIGVIPFFCLILVPFFLKRNRNILFFFFLFILILIFSMLNSPLNPYHFVINKIEFLQQFRIPSRIFIYLVPITLILSGFVLNHLYKNNLLKKIIIAALILNCVLVLYFFNDKLSRNTFIYSPSVPDMKEDLTYLKNTDTTIFYIAQSMFFEQRVSPPDSIQNEQKILYHNFGFGINNQFPSDFYMDKYSGIYPKYFILINDTKPPKDFNYSMIYSGNSGTKIYKNYLYSNYAEIYDKNFTKLKYSKSKNPNIKEVSVGTNNILVRAYSKTDREHMLLLESYSPGWKVFANNKQQSLLRNDFLYVKLARGENTYLFNYFSKTFIFGFIISLLSFSIFIFIIVRPKIFHHKNNRLT